LCFSEFLGGLDLAFEDKDMSISRGGRGGDRDGGRTHVGDVTSLHRSPPLLYLFFVLFDSIVHVHVLLVYPLIITIWVPFPFDQILLLLLSPVVAHPQNLLDFVLFFPSNQFWGRALIVLPMESRFAIRGQQIYVKHGVELPSLWKGQLIGHRGHHLFDGEGAMPSSSQLGSRLIRAEISPLQPN